MTSNTPSPRSRPSSVAGIMASAAGMISPSSEARDAKTVPPLEPDAVTSWSLSRAGAVRRERRRTAGLADRPSGGALRPFAGEAYDGRGGGRHVMERGPLADGVELVCAGEDV